VEQLEAWLHERGIAIVGQVATGSGEMVRLRLKLLDGFEMDIALSAVVLQERPQEAIDLAQIMVEQYESGRRRSGNGH
jgi:hypothetical protein